MLGVARQRTAKVQALKPMQVLTVTRDVFMEALELEVQHYGELPWHKGYEKIVGLDFDAAEKQDHFKEELKRMRCFRDLTEDFVMAISKHLEFRLFYEDDRLMKEGESGNELFILMHGSLRIEVGPGGSTFSKEVDNPGEVFGEMAVLGTDKRRTATVIAKTVTLVRCLHGETFNMLLEIFPTEKAPFERQYISRMVTDSLASVRQELEKMAPEWPGAPDEGRRRGARGAGKDGGGGEAGRGPGEDIHRGRGDLRGGDRRFGLPLGLGGDVGAGSPPAPEHHGAEERGVVQHAYSTSNSMRHGELTRPTESQVKRAFAKLVREIDWQKRATN